MIALYFDASYIAKLRAVLLALLLTSGLAFGEDKFSQHLKDCILPLRHPDEGLTLSTALKALSADYQAANGVPLQIFFANDVLERSSTQELRLRKPAQKKQDAEFGSPSQANDDATEISSAPASVMDWLKYWTGLADTNFAVREDYVLIYPRGERAALEVFGFRRAAIMKKPGAVGAVLLARPRYKASDLEPAAERTQRQEVPDDFAAKAAAALLNESNYEWNAPVIGDFPPFITRLIYTRGSTSFTVDFSAQNFFLIRENSQIVGGGKFRDSQSVICEIFESIFPNDTTLKALQLGK